MFGKLLPYLGNYKKYAVLTPIMVIGEVILEIFLPLIMSKIIDVGIKNGDTGYVVKMGALMVLMALSALILGVLSGRFAAVAAWLCQGLAKTALTNSNSFATLIIQYGFPGYRLYRRCNQHTACFYENESCKGPFMLIQCKLLELR